MEWGGDTAITPSPTQSFRAGVGGQADAIDPKGNDFFSDQKSQTPHEQK